MWTLKTRRERRLWTIELAAAGVAVAFGLAGVSCAPSYATNNDATVNLIVVQINGGAALESDVRETDGTIKADTVAVTVAVRTKNPNVPVAIIPNHVLIDSYEVRYTRSDGRGVEGVDVPYRITGRLSSEEDAKTSGTSDIPIEVVRAQAKSEPPLSTIFQTAVLTVNAQITLYGQTISGQRVSSSGSLQIDFADFVGTTPTP